MVKRADCVHLWCVLLVETVAEKKVKTEENVIEEEMTLEVMTSSDTATGLMTSRDMSHGDDVVSSTSDVYPCDYEGRFGLYTALKGWKIAVINQGFLKLWENLPHLKSQNFGFLMFFLQVYCSI